MGPVLGQYAGGEVEARVPGEGGSGVVEEDAPGGRVRAEGRSDVAAASGTTPG
jgi:hypothetical protein